MIRIDAIPLKSVGKIEFGMDRNTVRTLCGEYKEFKKSKFSKNTTDDFGAFHVYYSIDNKCEAVEIFDDAEVFFNDEKIFPTDNSVFMSFFEDATEEEGSIISKKMTVAVYAPSGKAESILFGAEGYYG